MIKVCIDGLFAPVCEGGVGHDRLEAIEPELKNAHRELMSRRGQDVGFYDVAGNREVAKAILAEVTRLRSLADDLVVLGIGGSSTGGQALVAALAPLVLRPFRVHFVDNVDPDTFAVLLEHLDPARTAMVAITKSGKTVETLALMLIMRRWFRVTLGAGETRARMTFVTDPENGLLRELSHSEGIRAFEIPTNVGGRYSVLTPVGLLPAAFLGIDIQALLDGAAAMLGRVTGDDVLHNPACLFAAGAYLAHRDLGRTSLVLMPYCDALRVTTQWFVQLWAESLAKRVNRLGEVVHHGQTPIPALGATDQHAQLQLFVEGPKDKVVALLSVKQTRHSLTIPDELADHPELEFLHGRELSDLLHAERRGTRAALLDAGVPVIDVQVPVLDEAGFGGLLLLFEAACATAGIVMGINPFDQPGIEASKRMALGLLGKVGYDAEVARVARREAMAQES
ncbi:MAG: glucose-6-phosphate isomerase [Deltaproteobacteria bacterium]|nr:glucose-6-phosphate isomerase [Deltaproteobacteria bacterium]